MSDWQSIEAAPRDGTTVRLRTAGGVELRACWYGGLVDSHENDCGGWHAVDHNDHPPCWTDGICWHVNEDGEQSDQPTHWRPDTSEAA